MKALRDESEVGIAVLTSRPERFLPKWLPVRRKKTRQIKNREQRSDSKKSDRALGLDDIQSPKTRQCMEDHTGERALTSEMRRRQTTLSQTDRIVQSASGLAVRPSLREAIRCLRFGQNWRLIWERRLRTSSARPLERRLPSVVTTGR
jgi:hypothetical protein